MTLFFAPALCPFDEGIIEPAIAVPLIRNMSRRCIVYL